ELVREEIRTVVRNNFTESPARWAVFLAFLLEYAECPQEGVAEAPQRILDRLHAIAPQAGTAWLARDDELALQEVERCLGEFEERQLLRVRREPSGAVSCNALRVRS